jgi:hypothetical protein
MFTYLQPSHAEDTYDTDEEAERQFTLQVQVKKIFQTFSFLYKQLNSIRKETSVL